MNSRGLIQYDTRQVYLNPMYNDDIDTLMHEIVHYQKDIYMNNGDCFSEDDIEEIAQDFLRNEKDLRQYLEVKLDAYQHN